MAKHACSARVQETTGFGRFNPCTRSGVCKENGKWWCRQHSPSSVKERREKQDAEFEKERTKRARQFACISACDGIPNPDGIPEAVKALRSQIAAFTALDAKTPWRESEPEWWLVMGKQADAARAALIAMGLEAAQ